MCGQCRKTGTDCYPHPVQTVPHLTVGNYGSHERFRKRRRISTTTVSSGTQECDDLSGTQECDDLPSTPECDHASSSSTTSTESSLYREPSVPRNPVPPSRPVRTSRPSPHVAVPSRERLGQNSDAPAPVADAAHQADSTESSILKFYLGTTGPGVSQTWPKSKARRLTTAAGHRIFRPIFQRHRPQHNNPVACPTLSLPRLRLARPIPPRAPPSPDQERPA